MRFCAALLALLMLAAILSACGGGGGSGGSSPSSPSAPSSTNASPGGFWQGQFIVASGTSIDGSVLVGENGILYADALDQMNQCANVMTGQLTVSGTSVSGNVTVTLLHFPAPDQTVCEFADGSTTGTGTLSGSIVERSTLTLMPKITTAKGTVLTGTTLSLAYYGLIYERPVPLSMIAGTWQSLTGFLTTFSDSGGLTATDPISGCTVSGNISIINASYNAYAVTGNYTACPAGSSSLNNATISGVLAYVAENRALFGGYSTHANGVTALVYAEGPRRVPPPQNLSYSGNPTFVLGVSSMLTPSLDGSGIATTWTIAPALPAGLTIDPASGFIGGTPSGTAAAATYTVTAKNPAGSTTTTLNISVQEIQATVTQVGSTGPVQAAVAAYSVYGITQVSATIDGQSLGTITQPNECNLPSNPSPLCVSTYYAFAIDAATLGSGSHSLVVQVTDGNHVVDTVTQQLVINNPPVVSVTPGDGSIVYGTLSVSGTAVTDKKVGVTTTVALNGTTLLTSTASSFSTSTSLSALPAGNYALMVTATDATGTVTTVNETITVASASNLVYQPLRTLGAASSLVAVDPTTFVFSSVSQSGINTVTNYTLQSGSNVVPLLGIPPASFPVTAWIVSNGQAFASGNAGDQPGRNDSVYDWSGGGAISNLSILGNSAGVADTLNAVHDGWVLWSTTMANGLQTGFELYNLTSQQTYSIPLPSGAISVYQGDFYVAGSGPVVYSAALVSDSPQLTSNVYQWNSTSGTTTLVFSGGETQAVQTDGIRVAWGTATNGGSCGNGVTCTLTALDIATSAQQQLSLTMQYPEFFLADGVLAWYESSSSLVGGVKDSPGSGAAVQVVSAASTAQLYGGGGGYVLYADVDGKLYAWNTATSNKQLVLDAKPGSARIAGKTVWFTNGVSQALYQVSLP